ncbi:MAG TPA: outer membrane beta-barrel domain-containing protein [Pseudobdellovibrionaceae bacterium]|jgi:outer membrane beta-barrel protein
MKNLKASTLGTLLLISLSVSWNASAASKATPTSPATPAAQAKEINFSKDVDGLGGNDALMEMAEKLNPESKSRIVQNRLVDRHTRLEAGIFYGGVFGGATYLQTQSYGATLDFHITPRWSLGARYYQYQNKLTPEGERAFDEARANYAAGSRATLVDIDSPLNAKIAVINWYPIYGKINLFDAAIAQFDIYLLAGGGQIELESGNSPLATGGVGFGLWMTKHLSARAEFRYQAYQDEIVTGQRDINAMVATVGLGWIL